MKKYVLSKFLMGFVTISFSFILTFFLIRLAPGTPMRIVAGKENPNPEQIEHLTAKYGLDKPVGVQFVNYIKNMTKGDFGFSYRNNLPVLEVIKRRIVPTLMLSLTSNILSAIIGGFMGLYIGRRKNSILDRTMNYISYIMDAIPGFWLAMIMIMIFSSKLGWFPTSGMYNIRESYTGFRKFLDLLYHMTLPILTIVLIQTPIYFRIARASVINTMNMGFLKTFRAAGLTEGEIFRKYVMKNSLIPILTTFSMSLAFTISGAALIEIVFSWPGMGRLIIDSINGRDYMVLNGLYLMISISVIVFTIFTDVLYAIVDPRIRTK